MLTPFDHALVVVLAVLFPIRAAHSGMRRLRLATPEARPRVRMRVYAMAMISQWTLAALTLALWVTRGRSWQALGLVPQFGPGALAVVVVIAGIVVALLAQGRRALLDEKARRRTLEGVRHLEPMLPHDRAELARFRMLSVTAGVCEELLYRGYMLWYLGHWMNPWWAGAASSAVFGIGHLYQGWRGILQTAGVGALMVVLYLLSGSLYLPMVAHAFVDLNAGALMHAILRRELERIAAEAAAVPSPAPIAPTAVAGAAPATISATPAPDFTAPDATDSGGNRGA